MADGFKIEGIDELNKTVNNLVKDISDLPAEIVKVLSTIRNNILNRTKSGKSVDGEEFKEYSKNYQAIRQGSNRQASPVSLTWTGNMLRSMKVFKVKDGGEIKFNDSSANDLAVKHNEGRGVPKREFFGLSKDNIEYIDKKLGISIKL